VTWHVECRLDRAQHCLTRRRPREHKDDGLLPCLPVRIVEKELIMKTVPNGMNVFSRAMRTLLTISLVFAGGCDAGEDDASGADEDDRGAGPSKMKCTTAVNLGDKRFVYETDDFMGTDDFVNVHITRGDPGGVADYGSIKLVADPNTFSWSAPDKRMTMTVVNKPDKQASIQVEHAINGLGKPGVVASASNGYCTFDGSQECEADQRLVCNAGWCGCKPVGEAE
jgi:hypothetical protein